MSKFFQETCKVLGFHKVNTTSYHLASNGMVESWQRSPNTGVSHCINSANNNSDVFVPVFLMDYRATPNTTTKYSSYLLHGREMSQPTRENLKAKISKENPSHRQWLENLKASLRSPYKLVKGANSRSHQNKKNITIARPNFENFK